MPANDTLVSSRKNLRAQIIEHVAKLSLASLIGGVGGFFNAYFAALLLGPTVWGIWQGAKLVLQYGANLHLGVQNGMHRELPILRGRGELDQQTAIINVTFTFSLIIATLASLGTLFSTFIISMSSELVLMLRLVAVMLFLQYIQSFYGFLFRANNEFNIVSQVAIIDGIGNLASVILVFFFGLLGFLGGQVLRLLLGTFYSWRKSTYIIGWRWDNRVLKSLIAIGFPIMLMIFANVIFATIDRLLILKFLDAQSLGFYSLGSLIFAPLLMILTASNSVMYPRFAERYGKTSSPCSLKQYITIPTECLATLISILIGVICVALPFLVRVFLPEYSEGIMAAQILIFGLFFYAIAGMAGNMLLTINKQIARLGILLASALLNFVFSYAALQLGYGIAGVAVGTSLSYFVFFLTSIVAAMRYTRASYVEIGRLLLKILSPIFCIGSVIASYIILMPVPSGALGSLIKRTAIGEAVLIMLSFYFVRRVYRSGLISAIFRR